jgi:cytoskeletal protein RodZ
MKKSIFEKIIAPVIVLIIGFFVIRVWLEPRFFSPESKTDSTASADTTASPKPFEDKQGGEVHGKPSSGTPAPVSDPPPDKPKPVEPETPNKYVYVTLTVDAAYSDAAIFANGVQIAPVNPGLTIKLLEIAYTGNTIKLEVKSAQRTCEKLVTVPSDYFNNPTKISVTCTQ